MKIVAFLQNIWVKDPERVRKMFASFPNQRESIITKLLFLGGKTGKNLQAGLGEALCNEIIWEETTKEIGSYSASIFPPDSEHVKAVLEKHKPEIVLCFGAVAAVELRKHQGNFSLLICCHPTARGFDTVAEIAKIKAALRPGQ